MNTQERFACRHRSYSAKILRRVNADRVIRRLDGLDPVAGLQQSQLLEPLRLFQRARWQPGESPKNITPVSVDPDVPPIDAVFKPSLRRHIPGVGNRVSREVQCLPVAAPDDLHDVRAVQLRPCW